MSDTTIEPGHICIHCHCTNPPDHLKCDDCGRDMTLYLVKQTRHDMFRIPVPPEFAHAAEHAEDIQEVRAIEQAFAHMLHHPPQQAEGATGTASESL